MARNSRAILLPAALLTTQASSSIIISIYIELFLCSQKINMENQPDPTPTLLSFFKALADENRLKMAGLLARQSQTAEQIAAALEISPSTTSHHLAILTRAGLISAQPIGHYYHFTLNTERLREMAEQILPPNQLPVPTPSTPADFEQKVLRNFTDASGRIHTIPAQEKKLLVVLRHCLKAFEPGVRYSEKEVNQILLRFNPDTAFLRRNFIIFKMMEREGGGGAYWIAEDHPLP